MLTPVGREFLAFISIRGDMQDRREDIQPSHDDELKVV